MKKERRIAIVLCSLTVCVLVGALAIEYGTTIAVQREQAERGACICRLAAIHSAKKQWALANGKLPGDPANEAEINRGYLTGGRPNCPAGGTYVYGRVGEKPRCSVPQHRLH